MRQLPATSNAGATGSTENSRSRSHPSNDSAGVRILSNGSLKEPILTRSKSRLRGGRGRRLSGRSPIKPSSPLKRNGVDRKRKLEKRAGTSSRHNSSSSTSRSSSSSPNNVGSSSGVEKMYARHYKSYRGLNGVKSRRNDSSSNEDQQHSPKTTKSSPENGRRSKTNRSRSTLRNNLKESKNGSPKNHVVHQNGISSRRSPSSPRKSTRNPSSRIRQLVLRRKKQLTNRRLRGDISPPKSPPQEEDEDKEKEEGDDDDSSPGRGDKAGKRRSALWVLNCEAESFLFGETAAEKDEIELPPLAPPSPPPKKRRWRATELGHLLEKTPILESKLRKSSSSESGSDMQRDSSPPRKRLKPDAHRAVRRVKNDKRREKTPSPEMCSSNSVNDDGQEEEQQVLSPKPELLSPLPFLYSPADSVDHETKSVQFRQMLSNMNWGYAFERPPYDESWWDAFVRKESSVIPHTSFFNPLEEQMVLPYEMDKPIRRSRKKPVKNSRKSPRCHASTLAILSSERPTRSTRNSTTLDASPTPPVNNLPSESTLQALLLSPTPSTSSKTAVAAPSTSSPSTSRLSPPKQIPSTTRRRHPSTVSPRPNPPETKRELGAAEYLWDSIGFLSDPYVVTLLAGDDPGVIPEPTEHHSNHKNKSGFTKNHRCTNNNYVNCPVKHIGKHLETSERKASLRSGDGSSANSIANSRLVSTPKSSPRNQSHHGTNNHLGGHHHNHAVVASPPVSPSAANDRVPPMNGITRRFTSRSPPASPPPVRNNIVQCNNIAKLANSKNSKGSTNTTTNGKQSGKSGKYLGSEGDNGLIHHDKAASKKSIILVSELLNASSKVKTINNWEEDTLFVCDGLPPLPQWPV